DGSVTGVQTCALPIYASILMQNPLAGVGAVPKDAPLAQGAIEKGRKMGAKTQRERDYIEAVAAYYDDFANRPERARQLSRAKARSEERRVGKWRDKRA